MHALRPADLVWLWETGAARHPIDRALLVLAAAGAREAGAEPERLALGERDALLLTARAATLGDRLEATERCPECGELAELALSCRALADSAPPAPERWTLDHDGTRLTLQPLDSVAAAAAAACGDAEAAAAVLLERAVVEAERDGRPLDMATLSADLAEAVSTSLAATDARAELLLDLSCPVCRARWQRVLDVAGFVWEELAVRGERLLGEVHRLASAYGWSEDQILALSDARRAAYVEMVGA
jgi:hypothetical protein